MSASVSPSAAPADTELTRGGGGGELGPASKPWGGGGGVMLKPFPTLEQQRREIRLIPTAIGYAVLCAPAAGLRAAATVITPRLATVTVFGQAPSLFADVVVDTTVLDEDDDLLLGAL